MNAMFVTKSKGVLAVVLVVRLALSGIGVGVGLSTNSVAVAQEKTGDQALDGVWEDIENKGGWLRFEGSTIKYHPADESEETTIIEWTCRYDLTLTPMTIDIFQKNGTAHGIFVVERGTLFIAYAKPGEERPTRFKRDEATTLFVLKRAVRAIPLTTTDEPVVGVPPGGHITVHGILEGVDVKKSVITVEGVGGNDASSVMRLMASASDKKPAKAGAADALLKEIGPDNYPKLVNVPVRANADGVIGTGVGFAKLKLKMEVLKWDRSF